MAEYIEREAVLAREYLGYTRYADTDWQKGYWDGVDDICAHVKALPAADVVPVVRCKDCVNGEVYLNLQGKEYVVCQLNDRSIWLPNQFCSYGERREEDGT